MTALWPQAACSYLAKALAAALFITGLSVAGLSAPPVGAAAQAGGVSSSGVASTGTGSAAASEQSTHTTSTISANGTVTMWCTRSNSYVNPGLFDLLGAQYQSGPVETITCVPAAVGRDGGVTVLSECTVSNTHTSPGALDLLAPQVQSGPAQTMTCVPTTGGGGDNGVVVLSACTVSNGYTNPGVLGLLASQFRSGPVQTVTCIPAAVVAQNAAGSPPGKAVGIGGSSGDASPTAANNMAAGASPANAADPSGAAQSLGASLTGQSTLARTGPAGSRFVVRALVALLIGLGVLGLRIARATDRELSTSRS